MAISRGQFLRSLGRSLPGYALGSASALGAKLLASAQASPAPRPAPATPPPDIEFIKSGPTTGRNIALTFDDGPTPGSTEKILDELGARNLNATFFMIGRQVAAHPEIGRRVLAEGHEIGNHTFTHVKLTTLPDTKAEAEIHDTQHEFNQTLGYQSRWFRPPFGELRQSQAALALRYGLRVVLFNVDSRDWALPGAAEVMRTILDQAQPGAIVACHDSLELTANSVGDILDGLKDRDLKPVTLSTLFNIMA